MKSMKKGMQESVATALWRVVGEYSSVREASRELGLDHIKLGRWLKGTMPDPESYEQVAQLLELSCIYDLGPYLVKTGLEHLEQLEKLRVDRGRR